MSRVFLRACSVMLTLFGASIAEQQSDSTPVELPTLYADFISAADTLPDFSVANVSIITPDDFSASDLTAADVVELSPSVQIQKSGELGSYSSVTVRGAPSQQTQIYIDGILQSNAGGEGGYLQHIPLADVERIEVYASSLPAQFSQATPGGAINIVRKQAQANRLTLKAGFGSFNQRNFSGLAETRSGHWLASAYIESVSAENNFPYSKDNGTPLNLNDDQSVYRKNAQYESLSAAVNAAYRTDDWELSVALDGFDKQKNLPHWNNAAINDTYYAQQGYRLNTSFSANQWLTHLDSSLRVNWQNQTGHFNDPGDAIGLQANNSTDILQSKQLQHHSLYAAPFGLITLANELHVDQFNIEDSLIGSTIDAQRDYSSHSLGAEWFANNHLTLAGTLRTQQLKDVQGTTQYSRSNNGFHLGVRFEKSEFIWQLNVQRSHRTPSLIERFGNQGSFVGNDELKDESAVAYDAALTWQPKNAYLHSSVFLRNAKNAIATEYNSQGIGRYINVQGAFFYGAEWQAVLNLKQVTLSSAGSLQEGVGSSTLRAYDQKRISGFFPVSTTQAISWQPLDAHSLSLNYLYEAGLYYDRANSSMAPSKHILNAEYQFQWQKFSTTFAVKNLTNQYSKDFSRKVQPGRSFQISFEYTLGDS